MLALYFVSVFSHPCSLIRVLASVFSQCTVYLAMAPKCNGLYTAYAKARHCILNQPLYPVPVIHAKTCVRERDVQRSSLCERV